MTLSIRSFSRTDHGEEIVRTAQPGGILTDS
jgi:hypothetical protein